MIAYWRDYLIQYILYIFFMYTGNKKWNFLASPRNQSGKDIITKCYIYHMFLMFYLKVENAI